MTDNYRPDPMLGIVLTFCIAGYGLIGLLFWLFRSVT